jgi:hypothetical protein
MRNKFHNIFIVYMLDHASYVAKLAKPNSGRRPPTSRLAIWYSHIVFQYFVLFSEELTKNEHSFLAHGYKDVNGTKKNVSVENWPCKMYPRFAKNHVLCMFT